MRELDEDVYRTAEELGIDISRPERGSDEEDAPPCSGEELLDARRQRFRSDPDRAGNGRRHPDVVPRRGEEAGDHQLPHAPPGEGRPLLRADLRSRPRTGSATAASTSGCASRASSASAAASRSPARRSAASGWATSSSPRPVVHIWYLRGTRSWLAYLLMGTEAREELKAKQLEKVIYFAAYLVTHVDEERRHADLPNLEAELGHRDRRDRAGARPRGRARASPRSRAELAELEAGRRQGVGDPRPPARRRAGGHGRPRARRRTEVTMAQARPRRARATCSPARSSRTSCSGASCSVRYGEYFEGGMGAEAIAAAHRPDRPRRGGDQAPRRDRPEPTAARRSRPSASRRRSSACASSRPSTAATTTARRVERPAGDDPRRRAGDPAGPAADGAARRRPLRDL